MPRPILWRPGKPGNNNRGRGRGPFLQRLTPGRVVPAVAGGGCFRDLAISYGAIALWMLGESAGTTVDDYAGSSDGTYLGGYTLGQAGGISGFTSVLFDGSSGYISVPATAALNAITDTFTLVAFVRRTATGAGEPEIISKGAGSFFMDIGGGLGDAITIAHEGTAIIATSTVTITDTVTDHMIAWSKNGAANVIYLDAADVTGTVSNSTIGGNTSVLEIGRNVSAAGEYMPGVVGGVAIFPTALTPQQISDLYAARLVACGAAFDPSVVPHPVAEESPIPVITTDDPQQAWTIQPVAAAAFDPAVVPHPSAEGSPDRLVVTDDPQQAWAIKPSQPFVGNETDDPVATPAQSDDPAQSYPIQPVAAAGFDPSTGIPLPQSQDAELVPRAVSDDPAQAWSVVAAGAERVSQLEAQVLYTPADPPGRVSQAEVQVLWTPTPFVPKAPLEAESSQPIASDDPQQSFPIQPPSVVTFDPATGIPLTDPQEADGPLPPVSDDPQQAWAVNGPAPAAFDPANFPTTRPQEAVDPLPPVSDDPQQAWAVNGPAPAVVFDPASGIPLALPQDSLAASPAPDDPQQPWAIRPALTFVANKADDAIAQPVWTDDPQQPWAINGPASAAATAPFVPPAYDESAPPRPTSDDPQQPWAINGPAPAAAFDPAAGFPWTLPQEPTFPNPWSVMHQQGGDPAQSYALQPPPPVYVVPPVMFDIETGDAFMYLGGVFIERAG